MTFPILPQPNPEIASLFARLRAATNNETRREIVLALRAYGREALSGALDALVDSEPLTREAAVILLGEIGDVGGVEQLIGALGDPDPAVREAAARALGDTVDKVNAAHDEDMIATTMEKAVDDSDAPFALAHALGDEDWGVRQTAAEILAVWSANGRDDALFTRTRALLLADLASTASDQRLGAALSLLPVRDIQDDGQLTDTLLPVFGALLDDAAPAIAAHAVYGLSRLGDRRALHLLYKHTLHPDETVRGAVEVTIDRLLGGA